MGESSANSAIVAMAQLLLLVFLRILPLVTFSPLFGGESVPRRMRTGIAVILALVIVLPLSRSVQPPHAPLSLIVLMAKEFGIGLIFAVLITITFDSFASFGALVDLVRGSTLSSVFDPIRGNRDSALSVFLPLLAMTIFLTLGGARLILAALTDSFTLITPYEFLPSKALEGSAVTSMLHYMGRMFVMSIQLASPIIAVLFLLDISLALINRFAPQIEVFFLSAESKAWIGLVILLLSLGTIAAMIPSIFGVLLRELTHWLR